MDIPKEVHDIAQSLTGARFQAYLVGGCVRDLLLGREPSDWDIATDAKPEEIRALFPDSVYENTFGTVGVKVTSDKRQGESDKDDERQATGGKRQGTNISLSPVAVDSSLGIVEVTTFRIESEYTDRRHPDQVRFAQTIEEDLARRDFTVNAMAIDLGTGNWELGTGDDASRLALSDLLIVDPFNGQEDLQEKVLRAVGDANERFREDALRLLRAVRLAAVLGFTIERTTEDAIRENTGLLEFVSKERIRDEVVKLTMSDRAAEGIVWLQKYGLLRSIFPELEEGVGVSQNKHHIYTVFEHNVKSLAYAAKKKYSLLVRVAALLHDVGKPKTKRGEGENSTFYGHQVVGERMVLNMLDQLKFPREFTEKVALLVREHMFVYDPDAVTLAGVRRLLRRVGPENVPDLIKVREADRIGSGVPKAQPYRLRYLQAMIEKVQQDPVSPKMLKLKGDTVMRLLDIPPGPRVGKILAVLLEDVLDDPSLNDDEKLSRRVRELGTLPEVELDALTASAKQKAADVQRRIDDELKGRYFVQ
ncbi:CCA tRNA nucleotidyltransferase [Candidatus Uhrbacteria bacterium]|nr:CCA tRNA nucleotidyltransferase [Candidatus Uhrbacteria bacterium]